MERATSSSVKIAVTGNAGEPENPVTTNRTLKSIPTNPVQASEAVPTSDKYNSELKTIALTWLSWQCRMVSGVICGALFLPDNSGKLEDPVAHWPETDGSASFLTGAAELIGVARLTQSKSNSSIRSNQPYGENKGQTCDLLACPLLIDDKLTAIVTLMVSPRSKPQCHAVLQLLDWGIYWLESLLRQEVAARRTNGELNLQLLSSLLRHDNSKAAVIETVNILADHLNCDRVCIGLCSGVSTRLVALSHVSHFDRDSQLIREIEAVMDEAVDQCSSILYSNNSAPSEAVVQAHASLNRQRGKPSICTIPLEGRAGYIGAISCEREGDHPFSQDTLAHCEKVAGLVGPIIEMMVQEERSLLVKGLAAFRSFLGRLMGLSHLKLKLAVISLIMLLAGLSMVQGEHQVKASATVQGTIRQQLVAPLDGYITKGMARAGDFVDKGELLATLDDRTLQLERQKWQSEKNKLKKEYQQAFSKYERTQLGILQAQIDKVAAEIQIIDDQIARTRLRAPFDGVIVSGDLSQTQGAPVKLGQVLFEVTPLNNYHVMLEVDEHDIGELKSGQTGKLVMAALPQTTFNFTLGKTIPVAISSDGYNYFRVEGRLDQPSPLLRPGMQGVAKITIQQRDYLWIWSHDVVDRLRMWFWSLGVSG